MHTAHTTAVMYATIHDYSFLSMKYVVISKASHLCTYQDKFMNISWMVFSMNLG